MRDEFRLGLELGLDWDWIGIREALPPYKPPAGSIAPCTL